MSRYNQKTGVRTVSHVMQTVPGKANLSTPTYGGADGHARDAKSELFIRATGSFAGQGSYYENADKRDDRLVELTRQLAVTADGWLWLAEFVKWLRSEGNMRTAPVLIASEAVKARLDAGMNGDHRHGKTHRRVLDSVMQRADEPGEMLAYWLNTHERKIPKPVKRALADAARRLYNEYSLSKYDSDSRGVRFADVLELAHPSPADDKPWQGDLFAYAIGRRHNRDNLEIPESLRTLMARKELMDLPVAERRTVVLTDPGRLAAAGMTWESLAGWLQGPMDAAAWEAIIPSMGYMALIRNLRNFDESGVSNDVARKITEKIADPEQVAKSRQLPFRFYSAYKNAPSLRWAQALEEAMDLSLANIPTLNGRTLVLIDTSGSMQSRVSDKSEMQAVTQAAIFGLALKMKNFDDVDVHIWADRTAPIVPRQGQALLSLVSEMERRIGSVGHGTDMDGAIRSTFRDHDRIIILSDMQAFGGYRGGVGTSVPINTPIYAWNLVGYGNSALPSGHNTNRYDLSGMTDSSFRMMSMIESANRSEWPWENKA